jgi:hypothetical protein
MSRSWSAKGGRQEKKRGGPTPAPLGFIEADYFEAATGFATGVTAALVDFTAFLCFFTFGVVIFVSGVVVVLGASCFAAPKAEATIIERASIEVVASFMAL